MKKAIGTVSRMYSTAPGEYFLNAWEKLILFNREFLENDGYIHYNKATVSYHELGRTEIVNDMRGDWILMLDTDHMFAPDLLDRMLFLMNKHNIPVLSGLYQYKKPPHGIVANVWVSSDKEDKNLTPILDWDRTQEIIQIGACGGGVLLIKREVFKKINEAGYSPFTKVDGLSEDYSFCYRCKQLDIPIHLAPKIQSHHVIEVPLFLEDYVSPNGRKVKAEDGKIIV